MDGLALKLFQAEHDNHLGLPLDIDGILGPQSRWALGVDSLDDLRQAVLRRCGRLARVGVVEAKGDNRHPFIDAVLERCGVEPGAAWCGASASYALDDGVWLAGARALGGHYPATTTPVPGDLGWFPTGKPGSWTGHVFIIGAVDWGSKQVMTYEGNSSNAYRVLRRPMHGINFSRTTPCHSGNPVPIPPGLRLVRTAGQSKGTR
jgi:hypothetical protein